MSERELRLSPAAVRAIAATHEYPSDVAEEYYQHMRRLTHEEAADLLAIYWIGRGDYRRESWSVALFRQLAEEARRTMSPVEVGGFLAGRFDLAYALLSGLAAVTCPPNTGTIVPLDADEEAGISEQESSIRF